MLSFSCRERASISLKCCKCFPVRDVDAEYRRLRKLIQFDEPPEDQPWSWRHGYTHGPAGHTVELCTPLEDAKLGR